MDGEWLSLLQSNKKLPIHTSPFFLSFASFAIPLEASLIIFHSYMQAELNLPFASPTMIKTVLEGERTPME